MKRTNICAVHSASSTALWWFSRDIFNVLATASSVYFACPVSSVLAIATVSTYVKSAEMFCRLAFSLMNPTSNPALCATRTASPTNAKNFGSTVSIVSASITMLSLMPVSFSISNGMGTSGLTKAENLSTICPFTTFTAPISIMRLVTGEKPVVSMSNTTKVSSSVCPLPSVTISFRSSTRYPSTP